MKKTFININNSSMFCALPENVFEEIKEAVYGVFIKYENEAIAYQWTMSNNPDDGLKTLYAKYPDTYDIDSDRLKNTKSIEIKIYGDIDKDEYWCESKEKAEEIVNNKYLRQKNKGETWTPTPPPALNARKKKTVSL
jgi:epoxyqueuosine reductase QueG